METTCQLAIVNLLADVIGCIRQGFGICLVIIYPVLVRYDGRYLFLTAVVFTSICCWQVEGAGYSCSTVLAVDGNQRITVFATSHVRDVFFYRDVCLLVGLRYLVVVVIIYPADDFLYRWYGCVVFFLIRILVSSIERNISYGSPSAILGFQLDVVDVYADG